MILKMIIAPLYMKIKKQKGGKRPGAGRKKGPKTVTLSYRVLATWAAELDGMVREWIDRRKGCDSQD